MAKSEIQKTPKVGDKIDFKTPCGTIPGTVMMILDEEMIVVNMLDISLSLMTLSKFGKGWVVEPMAGRAWKYPAYVELRRAEAQKKVGDHVDINIDTVVPSNDGDQHRKLPLRGTVKAIAKDGATLLDIEGFELYCGADHWIKRNWPSFPDGDPGVYLLNGTRIN